MNSFHPSSSKEKSDTLPIFPRKSYEEDLMSVVFTPGTVKEELKQLNVSKAAGPDKIHHRVLKELNDIIPMPLYHTYCQSLNEETLPSD